jgi:hypothetical protein
MNALEKKRGQWHGEEQKTRLEQHIKSNRDAKHLGIPWSSWWKELTTSSVMWEKYLSHTPPRPCLGRRLDTLNSAKPILMVAPRHTNCFSNSLFKSTSCRMKYTSVECAPSNENRKFSSRFSDKVPFTMYHHVPADSHYALQHRNITTLQNPLPSSVSLQQRARRTLNPRFFIGLEVRA